MLLKRGLTLVVVAVSGGCARPSSTPAAVPVAQPAASASQSEPSSGSVPAPQVGSSSPSASADADGDRIPDVRDRCPKLPEDYEGVRDEDGCPDDGGNRHLATPSETLDSLRGAYVRFNKGSARIDLPPGRLLEDLVKGALEQNQTLLLTIIGTGDTSNVSSREQRLAEARARAVRDYLVHLGISPSRLTTRTGELGPPRAGQAKAEGHVVFEVIESE